MDIGIIGAGNIGAAAARLFVDAGHAVAIANSRGPASLGELVASLGDRARAATIEDAARFGDVVLVAIPFGSYQSLPAAAFRGKIVIDASNYYPNRDGHVAALDNNETTSSELLQQQLPGASVVKSFNTIWSEHLKTRGNTRVPLDQRHVIFLAGDDTAAKATVAKLIEQIGFAAVDTGFLAEGGRRQQPDGPVYNKTLSVEQAAQLLGD